MLELKLAELKKGMTIAYRRASNISRIEWHGKIKEICKFLRVVDVEVLDEGYEGYNELVYFEQIIRVEDRQVLS